MGIFLLYEVAIMKLIKRILLFMFNKPNAKENLFQYLVRHFLFTDSGGNPSWTITILAWVIGLVTWVTITEIKLSHAICTINNNGVITSGPRGFSTEFMYLLLLLAGLIVFFFKLRGPSLPGNTDDTAKTGATPDDATQPGFIGSFIESVKSVIGSLKK